MARERYPILDVADRLRDAAGWIDGADEVIGRAFFDAAGWIDGADEVIGRAFFD